MDEPMVFNLKRRDDGRVHPLDSRFWNQMKELLAFQFPELGLLHENVGDLIEERIVPFLTLTVPGPLHHRYPAARPFINFYRGPHSTGRPFSSVCCS